MSDYPVTKDVELVLKASGLQGAGSVNGTGVALGPTGLVKAVVIVSVVASGGTLDVHLEESSDDSSYTNMANATIDQITAAGNYHIYFRATKKYVRYAATVGTNNVTWEAFVTRADL